ncbi:GH15 family glucan-1,4-alpha-glucosidase [Solirubrobacter pauli]|uniref:Trehalase n=1 Tax=Solirubrobacter pauli TaxID=166793 RepID=A0A660L543_9ACTN|nr:glycoside hydrolase family 15 protein [Solirubrobacter pauli]RKQ90222.1 GH15 family glucan-1,4-alpha-glucosidase [Solirubrobacter pauli]
MASRIEDYALIGDTRTAALVGRDGSIDWLCVPRFDSGACFAALLGEPRHGRWQLAPRDDVVSVRRRYRDGTLVLETELETATGVVRVIDCMPLPDDTTTEVARLVEGVRGEVAMAMELIVRFDYGRVVPWVRRLDGGVSATAGPDALLLRSPVPTRGADLTTRADFTVRAGDAVPFLLSWYPSAQRPPGPLDVARTIAETERWWADWSQRCTVGGDWQALVKRSLVTLKALTYGPTGGIVAAPTTSLPEQIGGVRNWDYRYCWLRDATLTLLALIHAGYLNEAAAWRDWLLRSVAGRPADTQIMYGPAGERRLTELELDWLPGYEGSTPVRVGNAASEQFQLDVYGEVMDALLQARRAGLDLDANAWRLQVALVGHVERAWRDPDEGIWEVRGPRRHFVHSKVMAWVALDRAIKTAERYGLDGPVQRWRAARDEIHAEVCDRGFDRDRGTFTQSYGSRALDAALLLMPAVGFLAGTDERVVGTIDAVERELSHDGFLLRYSTEEADDGLPPGEGAFLPCSFWLVDALVLSGRRDRALALFERLSSLTNDLGLLSEEYDPVARRQVGNFPQAFSHLALVNSALLLSRDERAAPADERANV